MSFLSIRFMNRSKIQILLIICLLVIFPWSVFARPADPNRFPNLAPLRPPMENISPNYQGNINFESDGSPQADAEKNAAAGAEGKISDEAGKQGVGSFISGRGAVGNFFKHWWWLIIIILIMGIAVRVIYKTKKNEKE